jgi:hypothetical protein
MTTPTNSSAIMETKFAALEKKHEQLQSQVNALAKQIGSTVPAREDVVTEPEKKPEKKPAKKPAKNDLTPAFPLPWTGTPIIGCCQGIRSNYDTFTQCHQPCAKNSIYCKTCLKNCGENGIPKEGNVSTRAEIKKKIKPYIHYMNAKKISQQQVTDEAAKFGITLSADVFQKPATGGKGRPKRIATTDSDDEHTHNAEQQVFGLLTDTSHTIDTSICHDDTSAINVIGLFSDEHESPKSP